jgi:uncharacterized membrane protein YjgN (DUF898 family)
VDEAKIPLASDMVAGNGGVRTGFSFDLRDLSGIFSMMGFATRDDVREVRDYAQRIEVSLKADIRELRAEAKKTEESLRSDISKVRDELKADIRETNEEIGKVRDELHGVKGMVAKWLIGTVLTVVGMMIAQTTLILSAIK